MHHAFSLNLQVKLPPLPQQLGYQLFLIAKEGLINVQKHSEATTATLSLYAENEQIWLTLTDNGCGFERNANTTGYGLQGIKERSQLLGGKVFIDTGPGTGTQLRVSIPRQTTRQMTRQTTAA